jgi:hypothetical protein
MSVDDVIEEFEGPQELVSDESIEWALDHWDTIVPNLSARLDAYVGGADRSPATENLLFVAAHLLAEKRETAAFQNLYRLLRIPEAVNPIIARMMVTETLQDILIGTFDGDHASLKSLIGAEAVDGDVRRCAFDVLCYLVATGDVSDDEMRRFMRDLYDRGQPRGENAVWHGWVHAMYCLDYRDLVEQGTDLLRREFVPDRDIVWSDIGSIFRPARRDHATIRAERLAETGFGPDVDTIATMEFWRSIPDESEDADFSSEDVDIESAEDSRLIDDTGRDVHEPIYSSEPIKNPLRNVGRNDPCPCGSGKKYKKCCLT